MRSRLLSSEKALLNEEQKLINQQRALEPIAARAEPYPLPRLPNGRLISIKKATATLLSLRTQLSSVVEQRKDTQFKLEDVQLKLRRPL